MPKGLNVTITFIKGVTIALSCWAGKIPYKQICFLTSFEPNKVYLGPNRNNKGVAITYFSGPEYPDFTRESFYLYYWYYELHYLVLPPPPSFIIATPPPPFHKPESQNKFWGAGSGFINVTVTLGFWVY